MTQLDPLTDALAATSLRTDDAPLAASAEHTTLKPVKPSFASALRTGPSVTPTLLFREASPASTPASFDATLSAASSTPPSPAPELAPVDDTILQAMRKRDDRIFFSQYENQMAAFIRDPARSELELGAMNAYQRLLIHRCADQFQLDHQLDRATHCITLSKTSRTCHPSALLSVRAREHLIQRDGIDSVLSQHSTNANLSRPCSVQANTSSSAPSASTSSPSSPAASATDALSPTSTAPKAGFKIMRRDPSSGRQSRLRSTDPNSTAGNNDSEKAAAKARKDMTLEEREASYKAARARIFGDLATSSSTSPTSSTSQIDQTKEVDATKETASVRDSAKPSPTNSAASSPVASIAGGRSGSKKKVTSSASSVTSQDGSLQRTRGNGRGKAASSYASDSANDDLEFSRALPLSSNATFGGPQQSSPLALPGHVALGYFPAAHPSQLQQSHSNPNLRSRAPVYHSQGSSNPAHSQGGALRYPDVGVPVQPHGSAMEADAFPAMSNGLAGSNDMNGSRQASQHTNAKNLPAFGSGAWNRSQATGQDYVMNGVGAWAQQTSTFVHSNAPPRHHQPQQPQPYSPYPQQQQQAQFQPGINPYQLGHPSLAPHYSHLGQGQPMSGPRSTTSSRASSQRGSGAAHQHHGSSSRSARDDAMSVASISSTSSSRSASFSGVSAAGSTNQAMSSAGNKASSISHPSLPARPAWLSPNSAE